MSIDLKVKPHIRWLNGSWQVVSRDPKTYGYRRYESNSVRGAWCLYTRHQNLAHCDCDRCKYLRGEE